MAALQSYFTALANCHHHTYNSSSSSSSNSSSGIHFSIIDDSAKVDSDLCCHTRDSPPRSTSSARRQSCPNPSASYWGSNVAVATATSRRRNSAPNRGQQQAVGDTTNSNDDLLLVLPPAPNSVFLSNHNDDDQHADDQEGDGMEMPSPRTARWSTSLDHAILQKASSLSSSSNKTKKQDWPLEKAIRIESPVLSSVYHRGGHTDGGKRKFALNPTTTNIKENNNKNTLVLVGPSSPSSPIRYSSDNQGVVLRSESQQRAIY